MRYLLCLALASGLTMSLMGCGASTEVTDGQQTAQNNPTGPPTGTAGPPTGGSAAPTGQPPAGAPSASPGGAAPRRPTGSSAGTGANPNPYAGKGGDDNPYNGAPPRRPSGAGAGMGDSASSSPYPDGFDPNAAGGTTGPRRPGGASTGNTGGGAGGASAPPPPGAPAGSAGSQSGRGAGSSGGASAPPPPGFDGASSNPYNNPGRAQPAAPEKPKNLKERAEREILAGHEDEAFRYLNAYYLTDKKGIEEQPLKFLPSADAPRTNLRWGIAIHYISPRNWDQAPPRLGDEPEGQNQSGRRGRSPSSGGTGARAPGAGSGIPTLGAPSASGSGGGGRPAAGRGNMAGELDRYTGDFGKFLLERLEQRRTYQGGFYGDFLAGLEYDPATTGNRGGSGRPSGYPGPSGAGAGASAGAMSPPGPPGGNYPGAGPARGSNDDDDREPVADQLQPGVIYLGLLNHGEAHDQATELGLDGLLMFTVKVSLSRGVPKTDVKLDVVDVATDETIYRGSNLNNVAVWRRRQDDSSEKNDPVQLALDDALSDNADEHFKLKELPEMSADDVAKRISLLTASELKNPLPALAEIRYYRVHDLIDDDAMTEAFTKLIGNNGKTLASGSTKAKLEAISRWMPEGFEAEGDDDDAESGGGEFR